MIAPMATPASPRPLPPLSDWPVQHARGGNFAWLTPEGPAIVTQTTGPRGTVEMVEAIHSFYDLLADSDIKARIPQLTIIHDWRSITGVDREALGAWTRRSDRPGKPFAAYASYVVVDQSPLIRMVLRTAAITAQMMAGQRSITFAEELDPVLQQHRVSAPPPGYLQRWEKGD